MKYYSLNNPNLKVSFKEAAITGIAPDKGLYFPESLPQLDRSFFENIEKYTKEEIAYQAIHPFIGDEIPESVLRNIISETLNFDFPIVEVQESIFALELYHGPTMAFKDVGARFMSRCLRYFTQGRKDKITILVATSGDTGGAVANGFYGVEGVEVVILYPSGKVSTIQEKQLTTLGKNISAIEVKGTFDDCQDMVKRAFLDPELQTKNLTSANSINIARWLPQMFYYFLIYQKLKSINKPILVSVPSGNFGNICAGMLAMQMGLPINHFIASTNVNDTVPRFMSTQKYEPHPTIETISNAMDVSNPSNFTRILELFQQKTNLLEEKLSSYSFSDEETVQLIQELYAETQYLADPHGAVGYLGLAAYRKQYPDTIGVFLETAHPVKFPESIEKYLGIHIPIPQSLQPILDKPKHSYEIESYENLKNFLLYK